jgi:hypothetical protein
MPRKVFTAGEVLAAADVNEFLMDQAVQSFAGTAARGSAIPTPVEGMAAFLEDSNTLSLYDGSDWKTSLATTGSILQVVTASTTTQVVTASATFSDTGLTATITPKSASSKILVMVSQSFEAGSAGASNSGNFRILRGATVIRTNGVQIIATPSGGLTILNGTYPLDILDAPNTTSAVTYKTQFNRTNGDMVVQIGSAPSHIILMEVAE